METRRQTTPFTEATKRGKFQSESGEGRTQAKMRWKALYVTNETVTSCCVCGDRFIGQARFVGQAREATPAFGKRFI
jgi:hypothetical protein